ncbi:MAG: hypothetical protein Q4B57_07460 [Eubacteriales bacterium]|nr:hypothetical protein [Eubacteriales bacterium]
MQLFVYISGNPEVVPPLMSELLAKGIHGATSVDCKGMLRSIEEASDIEAPPAFGALRYLLNPEFKSGKMVFIVLRDEDIPTVREAVHKICGNLRLPNTGVFFSVPVMNWEGVSHRE